MLQVCGQRFRQHRRLPFALEALEPAGPARRLRGRRRGFHEAVSRPAHGRGAAGADAGAGGRDRGLRRRDPRGREPRALRGEVRSRRSDHRRPLRLSAAGRRLLSLARRFASSAPIRTSRCGSGARPACASCRAATLRAPAPTARNPGEGYLRIAMVQNREITAEALHRLVAVLDNSGEVAYGGTLAQLRCIGAMSRTICARRLAAAPACSSGSACSASRPRSASRWRPGRSRTRASRTRPRRRRAICSAIRAPSSPT